MKILLDEDNYIIGYSAFGDIEGALESALTLEEIDIQHITAYKLINDVLIRDVAKYTEMVANYMDPEEKWLLDQKNAEIAKLKMERQFQAVMTATQKLIRVDDLSVEELASIIDLYPDWTAGKAFKIGDVVQYKDKLYKVIQAHTSQIDWTPDLVPALFVNKMPDNIIPTWVQPTGAHDAYALGAKVICEGKVYESLIAANVWKPVGNPSLWKEVV